MFPQTLHIPGWNKCCKYFDIESLARLAVHTDYVDNWSLKVLLLTMLEQAQTSEENNLADSCNSIIVCEYKYEKFKKHCQQTNCRRKKRYDFLSFFSFFLLSVQKLLLFFGGNIWRSDAIDGIFYNSVNYLATSRVRVTIHNFNLLRQENPCCYLMVNISLV